jgi:hypothetical protein
MLESSAQAFGEVSKPASGGLIPGEFLCTPRARGLKGREFREQSPKPNITEIHELSVLHIAVIRRVSENCIQRSFTQMNRSGIAAFQANLPLG